MMNSIRRQSILGMSITINFYAVKSDAQTPGLGQPLV
jgi:hypothetical protein